MTVQSYEQALAALALDRDDVVVLTAENRAPIRSLPAVLGARFVDVGICEQTLVGAAAGLALRGRVPVVHALAAFLVMRAFEFVRTDVGIAGLPVKLVGYVPGLLSEANGPTHQALEDVALMRGIPGMNVYCPADEAELAEALPVVVDDPAPWYVRFPHAAPVARFGPFAAGRAEVVTAGNDVAILTYGLLLHEAVKAARILEARGVASRVVHLRTLKPVDEEAIVAAARETRLLVTLEDHFVTGGLYSIAAELLLRRGLAPRTLALGLAEGWFKPALLSDVLAHERLDGEGIAERVLEVL